MTDKPSKPIVDRNGTDAMRRGKLLSALATTPDAALPTFADRCGGGTIDAAKLAHARDLLDAVAEALEAQEPTPWLRVGAAWRVIADGVAEGRAAADLVKAEAALGPTRPAPLARKRSRAEGPSAQPRTAPPEPPGPHVSPPLSPRLLAPMPDAAADGVHAARIPDREASPWVRATAAAARELLEQDAAAPPPAVGSAAPRRDPAPSVEETVPLNFLRIVAPALPFAPASDASPPRLDLPELPPLQDCDLDGTRVGPMAPVEPTLPFMGARSLRKDLAAAVALADRPPAPPAAPPDLPGSAPVQHVGTELLAAPKAGAEGSGDALDPAVPDLTVDQYASFCARCEVYKERTQEIERLFGISGADARRALTARWAARLISDRAVFREFNARFHEYQAWLAAERQRGSGA